MGIVYVEFWGHGTNKQDFKACFLNFTGDEGTVGKEVCFCCNFVSLDFEIAWESTGRRESIWRLEEPSVY